MTALRGSLHHLEIWVRDIAVARGSWGWLFGRLGFTRDSEWAEGESWRIGELYVVLEAGPDVIDAVHERRRPGLNHVAFNAGTRSELDSLVAESARHGWTLMYADRHPHAGGSQHYAAYLEDGAGFEVELVADDA